MQALNTKHGIGFILRVFTDIFCLYFALLLFSFYKFITKINTFTLLFIQPYTTLYIVLCGPK